jgi:diacylglycerol kinase (ATP)
VAEAVRAIREVLSRLQPGEWTIVADGARTTGEFLLVEVLNIRSIGPNLVFSADATPLDGLFRVVMAGKEYREEIARYLHDLLEGRDHPPSLTSQCARQVTLQGTTDIHMDDEVLSASAERLNRTGGEADALATIGLLPTSRQGYFHHPAANRKPVRR